MHKIEDVRSCVSRLRDAIVIPTLNGRKNRLEKDVEAAMWELADDEGHDVMVSKLLGNADDLAVEVYVKMTTILANDLREQASDLEQAASLEKSPTE